MWISIWPCIDDQRLFTARPLQPLVGVNPTKELAVRLAGKHVKPIWSIKMNISDLISAAPANAYYNVVLVTPNDAVLRRSSNFPEVMNMRTRDFPHQISKEAARGQKLTRPGISLSWEAPKFECAGAIGFPGADQ